MTKRSFIAIAKMLNEKIVDDSTRALLFCELATVFAEQNPTFDRTKWFNARKDKFFDNRPLEQR